MTASSALASYATDLEGLADRIDRRRGFVDGDAAVAREHLNVILERSDSDRLDNDVGLGLDYVAVIDQMSAGLVELGGGLRRFATTIRETVAPGLDAQEQIIAVGGVRPPFWFAMTDEEVADSKAQSLNDAIAEHDRLVEAWKTGIAPAAVTSIVSGAVDITAAATKSATDGGEFSAAVVTTGVDGLLLDLLREAGIDPAYLLSDLTPAEIDAAAQEMATTVDRFLAEHDWVAVAEFEALLAKYHDDPAVMAALMEALGPERFFDALSALPDHAQNATDGSDPIQAAEDLRDGLEYVPDSFQVDLGVVAADRIADMPESSGPHSNAYDVVAFVLTSPDVDTSFVTGFAGRLTDIEMETGRPITGGELTLMWTRLSAEHADLLYALAHDPLAFSLGLLGGDAAASQTVFTGGGGDRFDYLVEEREYDDGSTSLFTAVSAATSRGASGDDTVAAELYGRFTASVGSGTVAGPDNVSEEASAIAAAMVSEHMDAVELLTDTSPTGNEVLPGGAAGEYVTDNGVAVVDSAGLDTLIRIAGSTDAGTEVLAAGRAIYVSEKAADDAAAAAEMLDRGEPEAAQNLITESVDEAARTDAYVLNVYGESVVAEARAEDAEVQFWIDAGETALNGAINVGAAVGAAGTSGLSSATWGSMSAFAQFDFGDYTVNEQAAMSAMMVEASDNIEQITLGYGFALSEVGLAPEFPIEIDDFNSMSGSARLTALRYLEGEDPSGDPLTADQGRPSVVIDVNDVSDEYRISQLPPFIVS